MTDVLWDGARLLGLSKKGVPFVSEDGIHWSSSKPAGQGSYNRLASNGSQTIALGDSGRLHFSADALNWTEVGSGHRDHLNSVVYEDGLYVAAGDLGAIYTSDDGVNWTPRESGTSANLWQVAYGNGRWLIASYRGGIYLTSIDGINWESVDASGWMLAVAYGNGRWVRFRDADAYYSDDGLTWQKAPRAPSVSSNAIFNEVIWDGARFLAVGQNSISNYILTSPDGSTWTTANAPQDGKLWQTIAWNGNRYVVAGNADYVLVSEDAQNWSIHEPEGYFGVNELVWNGLSFIGAHDGGIMVSPDGLSWQRFPVHAGLHSVAYRQDQTVFTGSGGALYTADCPSCFTGAELENAFSEWGQTTTMQDLVYLSNTPCPPES
jgi:hypothetical protein